MNSFLYLDTFKIWDFISYRQSSGLSVLTWLHEYMTTKIYLPVVPWVMITWVHDYKYLSASCPMGDDYMSTWLQRFICQLSHGWWLHEYMTTKIYLPVVPWVMSTWLQRFICQLSHGWWVHDYKDLSASCPMGDELRVIET